LAERAAILLALFFVATPQTRGGVMECVICGNPIAPYHNVILLNTFGYYGPAHADCAADKAFEVLPIRQEASRETEEE